MPETRPPIELQGLSLAELQKLIDERRLPPVDRWNPDRCGHSGMRIARDGTWYHQGSPIRRPAMVRLFSTVLRREPDGRHVLVTPVEKLEIEVEATAFRAIEMTSEGEGARAPHRVPARQRRRGDPRTRSSAPIVATARPFAAHPRPPRARGRACAPGLLRAGRDRAGRRPRAARHLERRRLLPAGGSRVTLADRLRAALASLPPSRR